jgi:hypothetical protein
VANNLNVKIDTMSPCLLDVEDNGGQNQVPKNSQPQPITWHLTGELAHGNFLPIDGPQPGFEWRQRPKDGIFGTAQITSNGNSLTIMDNHVDDSSNGQWIYTIRVLYQGNVYSTTASLGPGATVSNPVIINKGP